MQKTIPIFIGYDPRERAAFNVLSDSICQNSSKPVSITPIVLGQLSDIFSRERNPNQSTEFSFTRFLVPYLMNYQGWAIFMDCDMLCRADIAELWQLRDDNYSIMVVKHDHQPKETVKFLGAVQTSYPKKNWSSLMIFNCSKCNLLTPEYVNTASGLDLHRFKWLSSDDEIGELPINRWNYLVDVQSTHPHDPQQGGSALVHWTLGGPWFKDHRLSGGKLAAEWFSARDEAFRLWD